MEAQSREIRRKACLGTGNAKVRRYRKSQSAADGRAVDGRADRLLVAEDAYRLNIEMADRAESRGGIGFLARFLLLPRGILPSTPLLRGPSAAGRPLPLLRAPRADASATTTATRATTASGSAFTRILTAGMSKE